MNRFCENHTNLINANDTQFLHLKIIEIVANILNLASMIAQLVKNPPTMQGTLVRFLDREDLLKKAKATHSSILAWRIPWTV